MYLTVDARTPGLQYQIMKVEAKGEGVIKLVSEFEELVRRHICFDLTIMM